MNPLTNVRNITKLSERELKQNDGKTSWHDEYRDSAWIFIGGLPYDLSEGDIIAVFSQYGEPVNLNLVRDKDSGKSKGFAFLCYEDQRSTILAVDNFNGTKIAGRTLRVDHVKDYKPPKDSDKLDDITRNLHITGCGPGVQLPGLEEPSPSKPPSRHFSIKAEKDADADDDYLLPFEPIPTLKKVNVKVKDEPRSPSSKAKKRKSDVDKRSSKKSKKAKKSKKSKKSGKSKKHRKHSESSDSDSTSASESEEDRRKSRRK